METTAQQTVKGRSFSRGLLEAQGMAIDLPRPAGDDLDHPGSPDNKGFVPNLQGVVRIRYSPLRLDLDGIQSAKDHTNRCPLGAG